MLKKILISFFVVTMLFSCSSNKPKHILFLGNNVYSYNEYLKEKTTENVHDEFLTNSLPVSYLYSFIEKNAENIISKRHIIDEISQSKKIYIQIGNADFKRAIIKQDDTFKIDLEIFNLQKELFSYYAFLIFDEIRSYFNDEIILLSPYLDIFVSQEEFVEIEKALHDFYLLSEEVAEYFSCTYIDIRNLHLFVEEDNSLNEQGRDYLYSLIYE